MEKTKQQKTTLKWDIKDKVKKKDYTIEAVIWDGKLHYYEIWDNTIKGDGFRTGRIADINNTKLLQTIKTSIEDLQNELGW